MPLVKVELKKGQHQPCTAQHEKAMTRRSTILREQGDGVPD